VVDEYGLGFAQALQSLIPRCRPPSLGSPSLKGRMTVFDKRFLQKLDYELKDAIRHKLRTPV
jgi:hypothetical protein